MTKWWILLAGVTVSMNYFDVCFKSIQSRDLFIPEQDVRPREISIDSRSMVSISSIEIGMDLLEIVDRNTVIASDTVEEGTMLVGEKDVLELLENSSKQMVEEIVSLFLEDRRDVCTTLKKLSLTFYAKISSMQAGQDSSNAWSAHSLQSILPYYFAFLQPSEFFDIVKQQKDRLLCTWNDGDLVELRGPM